MEKQFSIESALVAGFVATIAMTAFTYMSPLMGFEMNIPKMLAERMEAAIIVGWLAHIMVGGILAILYGSIFLKISCKISKKLQISLNKKIKICSNKKMNIYLGMIIITDNTSEAGNVFPAIINLQSKNITQRLPKDDLEKKLFINEELYEIDYRQNNSFDFLYLAKHSQNSQFDVLHKITNGDSKIPNKMACLAITGEKFHGFRNRAWTAEKGNIHLTIHFKPKQTFENLHVGLLVLAAVSILETIDTIPDLRGGAKTKWVNDIVIDNKKVAGIITQSFSQGNKVTGVLIGIGLNVEVIPLINKDIFTPEASCLKYFSNSENCNLKKVFTQLLARLSANIDLLNSADYHTLLNKYKKSSAVIGKNAEVYSDPIEGIPSLMIKGKVKDINERLELIFENSEEKINKGRLSLIE